VLVAAVSDDAVFAGCTALLVALIGVALEGNRRWAGRVERTVKDHVAVKGEEISAVAAAVGEVRQVQRETNVRLDDGLQRLARLEGAAEFLITRQSSVAATARATHTAVVEVAHQLETNGADGATMGDLASETERRRRDQES
jgi:hypothetical protein